MSIRLQPKGYRMLVWQNMHTHTHRSNCGGRDSTIANTVAEAESVGLTLVGICDHIDEPGSGREPLIVENMKERDELDTSVRVLIGSEVSMNAPDLPAVEPEIMATWDYVIISANHFHLPCVSQPDERTEEGYADHFLTMAEGAVRYGASIIPHPFSYVGVRTMEDGREIDWPRLMAAYDMKRVRRLFAEAAAKGTAFEINPGRLGIMPEFFRKIIRMGRDEGMKFSLGSDGHHPGQMHYGGPEKIAEIESQLRNLGVLETDICSSYAPRACTAREGTV